MAATLYDKLWDAHLVAERDDGASLLYIDLHVIHEVTSPQAFAGLRAAGRQPWRLSGMLATVDHSVPTRHRGDVEAIEDEIARLQVRTLDDNCRALGVPYFDWADGRQGIVHVVGPESGATLPGMTVVCGDSHTSTHGALGSLAMGIGTSAVEHVMATQCLPVRKLGNYLVEFTGAMPDGLYAKDLALALIGRIGIGGGVGYAMEFGGEVVRGLSMEGRMTLCNMSVEAGSRSGMMAVDQTTLDYVKGRDLAPVGADWDAAAQQWGQLHSDPDADWDRKLQIPVDQLRPQVTWGTCPDMVMDIDAAVPDPEKAADPARGTAERAACGYMGLEPGQRLDSLPLDQVFIGACTNSRLEDLRVAAEVVRGRRVAPGLKRALVVPGSASVREKAEAEGLGEVFRAAGFEFRQPGCSMCLGMNDDVLGSGERCISTANRNFEGRAGAGGRIHLASPAVAAASAVAGRILPPERL